MEFDENGLLMRLPNATGFNVVPFHDSYLLFNGEERVAVMTLNELAYLFDQTWSYLVLERHPILAQPLPSVIYKRPADAPRPSWFPPEPTGDETEIP